MSLHAFLALAIDRCLVFRQFKELQKSDAREGMVTEGFWESVEKFYKHENPHADIRKIRERAETSLDRLRCFEYASCWNVATGENALMWKAYAPQGIAIKTTVGKFKQAARKNHPDLDIRGQRIVYADHWRELERRGFRHNGIALNRLFLHAKRKAFSGEREIRFRISPPVSSYPAVVGGGYAADPQACPPWYPLKFKTLDWVDQVVAESSIPSWAATTIQQLTDRHNLRFRASGI